MANLSQVIIHLYPAANPLTDFRVADSGSGAQITYWNTATLGTQPTAQALATAEPIAQAAIAAAAAAAAADAAERQAVKDLRAQLALDIDESTAGQAEAQVYIDLAAPTNQQRNDEVLNSAKRDKQAFQRERRLLRAVRQLLKDS